MLGLWRNLHKSISGNALPMLSVKSAVRIIVSVFLSEAPCIY